MRKYSKYSKYIIIVNQDIWAVYESLSLAGGLISCFKVNKISGRSGQYIDPLVMTNIAMV